MRKTPTKQVLSNKKYSQSIKPGTRLLVKLAGNGKTNGSAQDLRIYFKVSPAFRPENILRQYKLLISVHIVSQIFHAINIWSTSSTGSIKLSNEFDRRFKSASLKAPISLKALIKIVGKLYGPWGRGWYLVSARPIAAELYISVCLIENAACWFHYHHSAVLVCF